MLSKKILLGSVMLGFLLLAWFVLGGCLGEGMAADYATEVRTLKALKVDTAPVLDGNLNDPAWKNAEKTAGFRVDKGKGIAKAKSQVMTCWSASSLYIAYICYEPEMKKITRTYVEPADRFKGSFGTDHIELFIIPDSVPRKKNYYYFAVSAAGQFVHKFYARPEVKVFPYWIYDIKAAAKEYDDRWQIELEIPFQELVYPDKGVHANFTPGNGTEWLITFARFSNYYKQEWSSWNAGTFHCRGPLGKLVFKDENPSAEITATDNMEQVIGRKQLKVKVKNISDENKSFKVVTALAGRKQEKTLTLQGGQEATAESSYLLRKGGLYKLRYTVTCEGKPEYTGRVLYDIKPVAKPVMALLKEAEEIKQGLPEDKELKGFIQEATAFLKEWNESLKALETTTQDRWHTLEAKAESFETRAEPLFKSLKGKKTHRDMQEAGLVKEGSPLEYGVGIADNITKVRPDDVFKGKISKTISFGMAQNEHEGRQLIIIPFEKKLKDVRFYPTAPVAQGGYKIPLEAIKIHPVGCVDLPKDIKGINGRPIKPAGIWPDPIMQMDSYDCEPNKLQSFWLDVHTAADQRPGLFKGTIEILPANSHPLKLNLQVKVWDFKIPTHNTLRVDYWFHDYEIRGYYGKGIGLDLVEFKKYARFLESYRLSIPVGFLMSWPWHPWERYIRATRELDGTYSFDFTLMDKYVKVMVEHGLNVFEIGLSSCERIRTWFPTEKKRIKRAYYQFIYYDKKTDKTIHKEEPFTKEESEKLYFQLLKELYNHLRKQDWFDFNKITVTYFGFDECQPKGEKFERMKYIHRKVKEVLPDVPRTFAMNTLAEKAFQGYVDIWIPVIERVTKEQVNRFKSRGEGVWWYTMGYPQWPDYFINQDGIDHRIIPWLNWKFKVDGMVRCNTCGWAYRGIPKDKRPK